jgi:isopenicillin-N N-acyltransferase-like protein
MGLMIPRRTAVKVSAVLGFMAALPLVLHFTIVWFARITPPAVTVLQCHPRSVTSVLRSCGRSYAFEHDGLLEVRLTGTPEQIGAAHSRLLYQDMLETQGVLYAELERQVPSRLARLVLFDLAQLRFRNVVRGMSAERIREIAAGAQVFRPDPYSDIFPTFQRDVYLNALYDIALSFERSPLVGCTTFTLTGSAALPGHTLLARAFDFEVNDVYDRRKAVFLVEEEGKIPYASVAWPGLVGVASGMNAEGVAVVVHGARAGETRSDGEPVLHTLRRLLATAHDAEQALEVLGQRDPMVSHIVILADAAGRTLVVERVPGQAPYQYELPPKAAVTNHFVGPSADDPKNQRVEATTSTLDRWRRGQQLVGRLSRPATVEDAVRLLRDRRGVNDAELPLGDRRAIDALIATHGVIMDTRERTLWVSVSPHLLGRFVAFDLVRLLDPQYEPADSAPPSRSIPEDPLLTSGQYERWRSLARPEKRTGTAD